MILQCATQEFLKYGFKDASLRRIAQQAQVTTGYIYSHFKNKESLFETIVYPVVHDLKNIFTQIQETFHHFDDQKQKKEMSQYTTENVQKMLDFIYQHFDIFTLLLDASYGTKYQSFIDELVQIEVDYTYKYMEVIQVPYDKEETEHFLHIITTAYFHGFFEVVRHHMSKQEAEKYITLLNKYHMSGFLSIYFPDQLS